MWSQTIPTRNNFIAIPLGTFKYQVHCMPATRSVARNCIIANTALKMSVDDETRIIGMLLLDNVKGQRDRKRDIAGSGTRDKYWRKFSEMDGKEEFEVNENRLQFVIKVNRHHFDVMANKLQSDAQFDAFSFQIQAVRYTPFNSAWNRVAALFRKCSMQTRLHRFHGVNPAYSICNLKSQSLHRHSPSQWMSDKTRQTSSNFVMTSFPRLDDLSSQNVVAFILWQAVLSINRLLKQTLANNKLVQTTISTWFNCPIEQHPFREKRAGNEFRPDPFGVHNILMSKNAPLTDSNSIPMLSIRNIYHCWFSHQRLHAETRFVPTYHR